MSTVLEAINAAPDVPAKRVSGRKTGKAPAIRKLKLRYPEMSEGQIAKRVGCSPSNVHTVLSTFLGDNSEADLRGYQEQQADIFDSLAMRLLSSITPDKISKSKIMEATTGAAILIDKARLVRGQATGINVNVLMDVVEALRNRPAVSTIANPQSNGEASASEPS